MEENTYKVIISDDRGEIKKEEIKRAIDLLKDDLSDNLAILEDLNKLLVISCKSEIYLYNTYLEMDFLGAAVKIFESEKDNDENVVNLLVSIITKICSKDFKEERIGLYKPKDVIKPIYCNIIGLYKEDNYIYYVECPNSKIIEDSIKVIVTIAKKYTYDVMNDDYIKNSYKDILPSCNKYSYEKKKNIIILFKEILKEGIVKKGDYGSDIIEEMIHIIEKIVKKKNILNIKEDIVNEYKDFVIIAKEKGFEGKLYNNKYEILAEDIYLDWIALFKEDCCLDNNEVKEIKEEEKEKMEKFCNYITSSFFDIQMDFIDKLYNNLCYYNYHQEFKYFKTRKNGLFLYIYLPLLFKIYHYEEILPLFLETIQHKYKDFPKCYEYIIKLYNEIIERMMEESKEIEMNEENIITVIFLWSVRKKEGKKEKENKYLINITLKVLEWLGKIEQKEEGIKEKEKEKELIKKENKSKEGTKEIINREEAILYKLLHFITDNFKKCESKEKIKEIKRINIVLLEIVKNHIKNERCLILKGDIKSIVEYIIYSYNKNFNTSDLLSLPSPSFPFSHNTIIYILYFINGYFRDTNDNDELIRKEILIDLIELLNNYIDILKIIDECNIKKEIERELFVEWKDNIVTKLKKKISLQWYSVRVILMSYICSSQLPLFDNENNKIIKRIINIYFNHSNNNITIKKKEIDQLNKDMKDIIIIRPFMVDEKIRSDLICWFISSFTNNIYYSMLDIYYFINKEEDECNIIRIFMKELSGEIVDRIKKREGNNIIKERRRYERERIEDVFDNILFFLYYFMKYTFEGRNDIYLGSKRNKDSYKGKDETIKEAVDYTSQIIEEEDVRECLLLFLKHKRKEYNQDIDEFELRLSYLSIYSNDTLSYLFTSFIRNECY